MAKSLRGICEDCGNVHVVFERGLALGHVHINTNNHSSGFTRKIKQFSRKVSQKLNDILAELGTSLL